MDSLTGTEWEEVRLVAPWTLLVILVSLVAARPPDVLELGGHEPAILAHRAVTE